MDRPPLGTAEYRSWAGKRAANARWAKTSAEDRHANAIMMCTARWGSAAANSAAEKYEQRLRRLINAAPPLTAEQRMKLAAILLSGEVGK